MSDDIFPKGVYRIREDGKVTEAILRRPPDWRSCYFLMSPAERLAVCAASVDRLPGGPQLEPTAAGDEAIRQVLTEPHPGEPDFRQLVITYGRRQVFAVLRDLVMSKALDSEAEIVMVAMMEDVLDNLDGRYDQGNRWIPRWMARSAKVKYRPMSEYVEP